MRGGIGLFLPRVLLAIARGGGHGYGLLSEVPEAPGEIAGPTLYRRLRMLEHRGLVRSEWATSESGPARRVYHLTPEGWQLLEEWAGRLKEMRAAVDGLLDGLETVLARHRREVEPREGR